MTPANVRLDFESAPDNHGAMTSTLPVAGLSIADAAAEVGLTTHTLRYYERDGLMLRPIDRSGSGQRRYRADDLRWVRLLTCLRGTGMPVQQVREYAALVRAGDGNEDRRLDLLRAHRERVLARLAETTEHLGAIDRKIGVYVDKLDARPSISA